jgi:hypothetical protein
MVAPRGDGHGVLVLPGLLASDASTTVMRRFPRMLGYQVRAWTLGRNNGPTDAVMDGLPAVLSALVAESGRPVSVVGTGPITRLRLITASRPPGFARFETRMPTSVL